MSLIVILGYAMVVAGVVSLVFNEFAVQRRKVMWSWRRDEQNPERDHWLDEYYRLQVYVTSIGYVEIGLWLPGLETGSLWWRVAIYLAFGLWLNWRRPVLRRAFFWRNLNYHPPMK